MNLFDFIIIGIVALAMLAGFAKGFFKSVSSLLGWLASIVLAILLAKTVANWLCSVGIINQYFFHNPNGFSFAEWIYGILPKDLKIDMESVRNWLIVDGALVEDAGEVLLHNIKDEHAIIGIILGIFENTYIDNIASVEFLAYDFENLAQVISLLLANTILVFFAGLLLLIVFKIITSILIKVIQKAVVKEGRTTNVLSRFFGMIIGGAKGVLICAVLLAVMSYIIDFPFLASAKKELFEKNSAISADFTNYSANVADTLLSTNETENLLEGSGFNKTIDLSKYPTIIIEDPDDENPDTEDPDTEDPDTEDPDTEDPDDEDPDEENPSETDPE